ncbi:hypothetical protein GO730_20385 [Spirosoma sp. HMF3257]|uniref:Uncharacterized protein n=1 Tax=Spirosoma telluris TaxID=2183553 RepID=A0A327NQ68_9BACT|nr:hypothetical protein [Spirosoma telluris]RAI75924.1 hypothetical protein HMF3257_20310 [Spirosoma telluris]
MRAEKYRQLNQVHMMHRIWRNELSLALQEVDFWEDLLGSLGENMTSEATDAEVWKAEISQLHHFRRLIKRLSDEIQEIDGQVANGVRFDHVLDTDTRQDHQYLREEMDSFHADFRAFKSEIRNYIVAQPTF